MQLMGGPTRDELVEATLSQLHVNKNLELKRVLLWKVFGTGGTAEEVCKMPQILGCSYPCLSSRLKVLAERHEKSG